MLASATRRSAFHARRLDGVDPRCTALRRAGLPDPEVHADAVSSLPRHPETGKLRRVIPA